jgi:hypothetical protein
MINVISGTLLIFEIFIFMEHVKNAMNFALVNFGAEDVTLKDLKKTLKIGLVGMKILTS